MSHIAVVGAGFSGTITALNLLRTLPQADSVLLCERGGFAAGTAYGTRHPDHLLNVRAGNMSAFSDQPGSFQDWLLLCAFDDTQRVHQTPAGVFASRGLYGRYLAAMLDVHLAGVAGTARARLVSGEVVELTRVADGFRLVFADGSTAEAAAVVLALGNLPSHARATRVYRPHPWAAETARGLHGELPVLVIGTGLTAMDLVVALHADGFPGPVIAVSRRGLLPREHAPAASWPRVNVAGIERTSLVALLRLVRAEIARAAARGVDWRAVIDALRPDTVALWRGLDDAGRARFLRHLRPFWDVHRHRLAPPSAAHVAALRESGYLRIMRGRLAGLDEQQDGTAWATLRAHSGAEERLRVQRVINATGVESAARCDDHLLAGLLRLGLAQLDPTGLGIAATERLEVIGGDGQPVAGLYALGPLLRGEFWECTAVPDIRRQAEDVATLIAARRKEAYAGH